MNTMDQYAQMDADDLVKLEQLRENVKDVRADHAEAIAVAQAEYRAAMDVVLDAYSRATRKRGVSGYDFDVNINELDRAAFESSERVDEAKEPVRNAERALRDAIRKAARDHAQREADMGEDYSNATNERRELRWEKYCDQFAFRDFSEWLERGEREDARRAAQ